MMGIFKILAKALFLILAYTQQEHIWVFFLNIFVAPVQNLLILIGLYYIYASLIMIIIISAFV